MRVDRGLVGWGVFLVLVGAVPLAVRSGVVDASLAERASSLWPLLIVAAGIGLLARGTPAEAVAGLAFPVVFGLIVGGVVATGRFPFGGCSGDPATRAFEGQNGTFGETATVEIDLPCGELEVVAVAGSAWAVEGTDEDGDGPQIDVDEEEDRVEIRERGGGLPFFRDRSRWSVEIPTTPRVAVEATVNAGQARFVLGGATLGPIDLTANAGSVRLDLSAINSINGNVSVEANAGSIVVLLPNQSLSGEFQANAGSIVLCTPPSAGIRIEARSNLGGVDFAARGLIQAGDVWQTPDFASAEVQLELRAEANAGSIAMDDPDDCQASPSPG